MIEWILEIAVAPLQSVPLLGLSIIYVILTAVNTYDVRLIQAKKKGSCSGVAARATGRMLPSWVGFFHIASFVVFVPILILDWKFAILLFTLVFFLKVLPVLEVIGEVVARPLLVGNSPVECEEVESYDLETILLEAEANKGSKLTPEEVATFRTLCAEVDRLEAEVRELREKDDDVELERLRRGAEEVVAPESQKARLEPQSDERTKAILKERAEIKAQLKARGFEVKDETDDEGS